MLEGNFLFILKNRYIPPYLFSILFYSLQYLFSILFYLFFLYPLTSAFPYYAHERGSIAAYFGVHILDQNAFCPPYALTKVPQIKSNQF